MIGVIAGDVIGSRFEFVEDQIPEDFELFVDEADQLTFMDGNKFTDDTVLTIATADYLVGRRYDSYPSFREAYLHWYLAHPKRGYGTHFAQWAAMKMDIPYNSFGNGSAMRVAPVAHYAFHRDMTLEECLDLAEESSKVTHNHPEGIKGAKAVAGAMFILLDNGSKNDVYDFIVNDIGYSLDFDYQDLLDNYTFDVTCQGSVPQSIYCFLISNGYEDAIRKAIRLNADTDTMGAIVGGIAETIYSVPDRIITETRKRLTPDILTVLDDFTPKLRGAAKVS